MRKNIAISAIITVSLITTVGSVFLKNIKAGQKAVVDANSNLNAEVDKPVVENSESAKEKSDNNQPVLTSPENTPTAESKPQNPLDSKIVAPMSHWKDRITLNPFGNYFGPGSNQSSKDAAVCRQGKSYVGYHTGDDLEATMDESDKDVQVYAIADGTVKEAAAVNGYGGLIVIEHNLNGEIYTAYYGHINLTSTKLKAGDKVSAGQKIAILGDQCSSGNGYTRKHLHFALHRGSSVVVAGYVSDKKTLSNWVDARTVVN